MIKDTREPALRSRTCASPVVRVLGRIFAHGPGQHPVAELQQQLIGDPGCVGGAPWLDAPFAVKRVLFAQEEVFRRRGSGWA